MKCPRDGVDLSNQGYWKHPRHQCARCTGFLVSEAAILEALGHPDQPFAAAMAHRIAQLPPSGILCPRDGQQMRALLHKGVEIDICEACRSVWLDAGEFSKVALTRQEASGTSRLGDVADGVSSTGDLFDFLGEALGSIFDL
jgi:hypothetical protein